jgi:hypothetical protein
MFPVRVPSASRPSDFLCSRSKFLAESLPLRFFSFAINFFVRLHLLIFWFHIDFSWAGFLLPRAQIQFAAKLLPLPLVSAPGALLGRPFF